MRELKQIKEAVTEIVEIVKQCPENLQVKCFETLLEHYLSGREPSPRDQKQNAAPPEDKKGKGKAKPEQFEFGEESPDWPSAFYVLQVLPRQAVELTVNHSNKPITITPAVLDPKWYFPLRGFRFRHGRHLLFAPGPFCCHGLRLECGALSDPEQPIGDHLARSNRHRFAGQNQESGLKRILGVLVMRDNSAAHAPDHRAMSLHESGKRVFVLVVDEKIQQLAVAHAGFIGKGSSAKILDNLGKPVNRHVHHPRAEIASYILLPGRACFHWFFSAAIREWAGNDECLLLRF